MSNYDQFRDKLREIFMMDHAELDFGIYRIMNQKRGEINYFLDKVLLPQVKKILGGSNSDTAKALQQELDKAIKQCQELEIDPNTNKKVIELREKIDASSAGNEELENEVFNHLTIFFSRYYDNGDFVSKRRYKDNAYAIPYNGEEVKLHWANSDQYYIKTSEYFQNYTFNVLIDEKTQAKKKVHFVLKDVTTEQNNNKAASGMERRFALYQNEDEASIKVIQNEDGENELNIYFTYELMPKGTKQDALMASAFDSIKGQLPEDFKVLTQILCPTEKNKKRTLLEKHLTDYTAKNSFDYFIHKDLGGFLRRELDFYIKNEVLLIDDLDEKHVMQQLSLVRAIKGVGEKIITMLAQIEDFQKRLWLKKKFVVQSDYCITLDRVPESFYAEICENEAQRKEWVRLFAIDEIQGDLVTEPYSEPLTKDFLRQNPYLVLDTAFFSTSFKHRLLSKMEDVDKNCNGLLINSENFQALELLQERACKGINAIYVDPPYNTNASEIIYRNGYKNSSWISMIQDRMIKGANLLDCNSVCCTTIDDFQVHELHFILNSVFGKDNHLGTVTIKSNPQGRSSVTGFQISHEYGLFYGKGDAKIRSLERNDNQVSRYSELDEKGPFEWRNLRAQYSQESPKMVYPIFVRKDLSDFRIPQLEWDNETLTYIVKEPILEDEYLSLPIDESGRTRTWKYALATLVEMKNQKELGVRRDRQGNPSVYYKGRMRDEGMQPFTIWDKPEYSASTFGANLLADILGKGLFSYPKALHAVADALKIMSPNKDSIFLDYFAGSGTTAHAIITQNRKDNGDRKYILCEMGLYFDKVTRTRIQKVIYSEDWKDGKPVSRKGISQCFKYIRLEQYEDTLNNLEVKQQGGLFDKEEDKDFRESYMLQYMMDMDTRDSLFNIERFVHPFDVKLKTTRDNELVETNVDMVETFNYLIGLEVDTIRWTHADEICVVEGRLHRSHDKALVIWRDTEKVDNTELNAFFRRNDYRVKDAEYDVIYVNGDNTLQNQKRDDEHWKVVLIEEEFQKRMFEEC